MLISMLFVAVPAWVPGGLELMIVALIVLLLFGNRLPSVMRSLGSSVTEFKKGVNEADPVDSADRKRDENYEQRTKPI